MTRGAPAHRSLVADENGAVYLEFLIAFVPIWTFSLCVLQLALIARADLLVRHAAEAAARSASVVLPDDPNEYGGEPTMSGSLSATWARSSIAWFRCVESPRPGAWRRPSRTAFSAISDGRV